MMKKDNIREGGLAIIYSLMFLIPLFFIAFGITANGVTAGKSFFETIAELGKDHILITLTGVATILLTIALAILLIQGIIRILNKFEAINSKVLKIMFIVAGALSIITGVLAILIQMVGYKNALGTATVKPYNVLSIPAILLIVFGVLSIVLPIVLRHFLGNKADHRTSTSSTSNQAA
jgi:hypothetical protein